MSTPTIKVKLFGSLRGKDDQSDKTITISRNDTIQSVVARLPIEPLPSYLYSVNGHHAKASAELHDGDVLMIIPPISGG